MRRRIGLLLSALALPVVTPAQGLAAASQTASGVEVGGTATTDFITLRSIGPGVPLRFGGVTPQSETVTLDGVALERGVDYNMDYATGVVYLMRAQRAGQVLLVNYRYDAQRAKLPAQPFAGMGGFKFDLMPGGLSMYMGLGIAERAADGNVLTGNMLGWNNSFSLHGGATKGLFLLSQKQKVDSQSGFEYQSAKAPASDGHSELVIQSLESGVSGGKVKLDYQNVGRSFTGFGEALAAGYDQKTVDQLTKEKGLRRMGFAMDGVKFGSLALSDGMRTVGDTGSAISWKSFGLKQGGLDFNWQSRSIDSRFTRFGDLAETDKDQLKKEVGLTREGLNALYGARYGKLGFTESRIQDTGGQGIEKRQYTIDASKLKFNLSEQAIDSGFTRFGSLFEQDKAQWGKEAGLRRQSMALDAALLANQPLHFTQSLVHSTNGDLLARDLSYSGKTWSLRHDDRKVDQGFGALSNLPGAEVDDQVKAIAAMYGPDIKTTNDDRNAFLHSSGIARNYTQLQFKPFKDYKLAFDDMKFRGHVDGGEVEALKLEGKMVTFNARRQSLGANFTEIGSLMSFEKARLGTISGLERTDVGLSTTFAGNRKFAFNSTNFDSAQGGAKRMSADFTSTKLDASVSTRRVDQGFAQSSQVLDPEKDLISALRGYKESEAKLRWQLMPGFKINALFSNANGEGLDQEKIARDLLMSWTPNKQTSVEFTHQEQHSNDPLSLLFANVTDKMMLMRDFGRLGKLKFTDISQEFGGSQAQNPGFKKEVVQYETKLDGKTTLATEESRTKFDDGSKEDVNSETVSTSLTKGSGVSVTDTTVDRDGTEKDEHKRNYGFWYTLPNGMKIAYGYARQLEGAASGTYQSNVSVGGGTLGGVKVDNSGYNVSEWDRSRTQATSNVSLSSARPLRFGRITDLKFNFGMDTVADYSNWLKENRLVSMSGKYGSNTIGYLYKSQLGSTGERGIDRAVQVATDQSDKSKLSASFSYKLRTLPGDQQVMIRDYNFKVRPAKDFELINAMVTHPEVAKPDAILGSATQDSRVDKWKLNYKKNPNVTIGGSYDESVANGVLSRTGGFTLTMNAGKGSPFSVFYGGETSESNGQRRSYSRYELRYDQKTGPNQKLSLMTGNVTYERTLPDGGSASGITVRIDYQLRF